MSSIREPSLRAAASALVRFLRRPAVLQPTGLRAARAWGEWAWLTALHLAVLIALILPFIALWSTLFGLPSAEAFDGFPKAWLIPTVVLFAPIGEELLFRGWQNGRAPALWLLGCALVAGLALMTLRAPSQALLAGAIILAMLIAMPIGWWLLRKNKAPQGWFVRGFPAIFYLVAVLFALGHLSNYPNPGLLTVPMVLPQLWAALVLGFVRQRIGLPASILTHASSNAVSLGLALLFGL